MEDAYSFEELQCNLWKLAGLEFQLRRSCSSNADLVQLVLGWGRKGGTRVGGGAGHWLPSVKSPLLWNLLPPIVCCSSTFSSLKWHFRFFSLDMLSVPGEILFHCWFWCMFCVSRASSSQSVLSDIHQGCEFFLKVTFSCCSWHAKHIFIPQHLDAYHRNSVWKSIAKPAGGTQNLLSMKSLLLPQLEFIKTLGLYFW